MLDVMYFRMRGNERKGILLISRTHKHSQMRRLVAFLYYEILQRHTLCQGRDKQVTKLRPVELNLGRRELLESIDQVISHADLLAVHVEVVESEL